MIIDHAESLSPKGRFIIFLFKGLNVRIRSGTYLKAAFAFIFLSGVSVVAGVADGDWSGGKGKPLPKMPLGDATPEHHSLPRSHLDKQIHLVSFLSC